VLEDEAISCLATSDENFNRRRIQMLSLFFAMLLTNAQQAQHDRTEFAMYQHIQADQDVMADIWHPSGRLVADMRKARACYTKFHLYKASNCDPELSQMDRDLGEVELAQSRDQ
jgi:hypothetical protein